MHGKKISFQFVSGTKKSCEKPRKYKNKCVSLNFIERTFLQLSSFEPRAMAYDNPSPYYNEVQYSTNSEDCSPRPGGHAVPQQPPVPPRKQSLRPPNQAVPAQTQQVSCMQPSFPYKSNYDRDACIKSNNLPHATNPSFENSQKMVPYHHSHSQQAPPIAYSAPQHNVKQPHNPSAPSANAFAFTARKESVQMVQGHISVPQNNTAGLGPATQAQCTVRRIRREITVFEEIAVTSVPLGVGHAAVREQPLAIEARVEDSEEVECNVEVEVDSCFEKCMNCCCLAYDCSCTIKIGNLFHKNQFISDTKLKEASREGRKEVKNILFSLLGNALRMVWVILQLIFALLNLSFSIAIFAAGNNELFNIIHLVLSIISTGLVIIDSFVVFYRSCQKTKPKKENHPFDLFRLLITEIILFPLLICNFFEVSLSDGNVDTMATTIIGLVLLAVDSMIFIATVFLIRLYMVIAAIMRLKKHFKDKKFQNYKATVQNSKNYKATVIGYSYFFLVHVIFQMISQVLMFVIISSRIRYDHQNRPGVNPTSGTVIRSTDEMGGVFNQTSGTSVDDVGVYVSPRLWYMMIVMSFLPLFGYFTYFVVTKYWLQEFPALMGFVLAIIKKEDTKEDEGFNSLDEKCYDLHKVNVCIKILLPFKSPFVVLICFAYTTLVVAFFLCAGVQFDGKGLLFFLSIDIQALSIEWSQFVFGAGIFIILANLYVFAIVFVWTCIIIALFIYMVSIIILSFISDYLKKKCSV